LGRVLGLFTSIDNGEFDEMKRDLNRARAQDRRTRDEDGNSTAGIIVRGILEGRTAPANTEIQQQTITLKWMKLIRDRFRGKVMRRTGNSTDNEGKLISGIAAPSQHLMLLNLYDWERNNLEQLADKLLESPQAGARLGSSEVSSYSHVPSEFSATVCSSCGGAWGSWTSWTSAHACLAVPPRYTSLRTRTNYNVSQNFYLDTRRSLLHPSCSPGRHDWVEPKTTEEWNAKASVKLDALVQVLKHHLAKDNAAPLCVTSDGHTLEPSKEYVCSPRPDGLHPDKIVVYSEFPSSNPQITSVSRPISVID
jgi:hypothetical protein